MGYEYITVKNIEKKCGKIREIVKFCEISVRVVWYLSKYTSFQQDNLHISHLTHWGRVTHICTGKLTIIGSDNGLSPERCQAIIWTNAGILLIGPLGTNFNEILIEIQTFSLKKIRLKMSSAKCCSFRLGLNVLIQINWDLSFIYQGWLAKHKASWWKGKRNSNEIFMQPCWCCNTQIPVF